MCAQDRLAETIVIDARRKHAEREKVHEHREFPVEKYHALIGRYGP